MNIVNNIIYDSVYHSIPILLCVLGGIFAYKANVLNIALEGMMLIAAFSSTFTIYITGNIFLGIVVAIFATLLTALVFCIFGITLKSNFIIVGLGINLFVAALTSFLLKYKHIANVNVANIIDVAHLKIKIPILGNIPIISSIVSEHTPITYISIALIFILSILMFKTKIGMYIRVCGENEEAARSVGINVDAIRYISVFIGAILCALAGINFAVERLALFTPNMTAGRGFIAIAAIFCGKGMPKRSCTYAFLFGLAKSLSINLGLFAGAYSGIFEIVPYIAIIIILSIVSIIKMSKTHSRGIYN